MTDTSQQWLPDTKIDKINLEEECVKQPGLFGYWAHQELQCIIAEDEVAIKLSEAEDTVAVTKARVNADMRGMTVAEINKLLNTKLPKLPDVALWKDLVMLHPEVKKVQTAFHAAQRAFVNVKHARLDRKNARRAMEAKAQELNNIIYLHNREQGIKDSYALSSQPKHVRQTAASTIRNKAQDAMATALKKNVGAGAGVVGGRIKA